MRFASNFEAFFLPKHEHLLTYFFYFDREFNFLQNIEKKFDKWLSLHGVIPKKLYNSIFQFNTKNKGLNFYYNNN